MYYILKKRRKKTFFKKIFLQKCLFKKLFFNNFDKKVQFCKIIWFGSFNL